MPTKSVVPDQSEKKLSHRSHVNAEIEDDRLMACVLRLFACTKSISKSIKLRHSHATISFRPRLAKRGVQSDKN
jgi:hypothetical protein